VKHLPSILPAAIAMILIAAPQLFAAGITISLTQASATTSSTGNSFEVDLTNMSSSSITVGGFSFELSIANPNISLTGVTTSTAAAYVFSGDSTFGPDLTTFSNGQLIDASDIDSIVLAGTTIDPGATFGLGRVFFDVSSSALPGVTTVNLSPFPETTLSDAAGNDLPIGTLSPGQITILGSTVPEPSSLLLISLGAAALLGRRSRYFRRAPVRTVH